MPSKKLVKIVNRKNRIYNGIKYQQVAEVSEDNLSGYLANGFELFKPKKDGKKEETPANPEFELSEEDREAREAFLKGHGVGVNGNRKDKTVYEKSEELGYEEPTDFDPAEDEADEDEDEDEVEE